MRIWPNFWQITIATAWLKSKLRRKISVQLHKSDVPCFLNRNFQKLHLHCHSVIGKTKKHTQKLPQYSRTENYDRYPKISFLSHIISIHMETKSKTVVSLWKIVTSWSRCESQDNNEKCLLDQCLWPSVYMTNCKYMENC